MGAWADHVLKWKDCTRCPLCDQRDRICLARAGVAGGITTGGGLPCDVLFVGEAPGASENAVGLPFIGPAGDLLEQVIERALPPGMTYAMTNLVACFPREAKNRGENEPEYKEILACRPRLQEFIKIASPKLVVRIGTLAGNFLEHDSRGKVAGVDVVDIIHPAATMGNRMPLAQRGMAMNRAVIQVRCAVQDMLQCGHITKGDTDAYLSQIDTEDRDIPF